MTVRVRDIDANTRHCLEQALYKAGIPLSRLQLARETDLIDEAYPLRADFSVKVSRELSSEEALSRKSTGRR